MKRYISILACCLLIVSNKTHSQSVALNKNKLEAVNVFYSIEKSANKDIAKVIKDSAMDQADAATFVKIKGIDFKDGTIELKILSKLLKNAPDYSRGFIGIAFRINEDNSKFECIYLRPVNARVDDQLRRNHSIQYYSFPDYKFDRLRKEAAGEYESYADMAMNEWIKIKITVKGKQAKLFINDNKQPSLVVNDLKHGENASGAIGLWVDTGTEGYFSDLKVYK